MIASKIWLQRVVCTVTLLASMIASGTVAAQDRTIRIVVGYPGGRRPTRSRVLWLNECETSSAEACRISSA